MRSFAGFICCALLVTAYDSQLFAAINANVNVDATQVRAMMSPLGLGVHTSPYYNQMSNANVDNRLEEAGVTTLRYGGGGYADVFHWSITRASWENDITGGGLSPWWGEPGNFGYVGSGSDFASFVHLLDQIDGGQAVVTVNYGSAQKLVGGQSQVPDFGGQPQEAAAWVAYANADPNIYGTPDDIVLGVDQQGNDWKTAGYWAKLRASTTSEFQTWASADGVYDPLNDFLAIDRDTPVGIQYWEIGNETFGTGYYDSNTNGYSVNYDVPYPYGATTRRGNPDLSPAHYGQEVVQYAELMKAIDPNIKIGAVLTTPPDDYGWDYWPRSGGPNNPNNQHWNEEVLSQTGIADNVDFVMVHWYPYAGESANGASLLSDVAEKIPRMIEGSTAGLDTGSNAGVRDWLALYSLPGAEIMVTEFNYFGSLQSGLANAAESIYVADAYASWLEQGVTSVQYLEMLTKDFLSDSGPLSRGSAYYGISMVDKLIQPGEASIDADSSDNTVRVHAARQEDGSIAIMLLNTSLTETANISLDVQGQVLDTEGVVFSLTSGTNLFESAADNLGNTFVARLAPRSISVYQVFPVPMLAGDFDGDGIVDGQDFLIWQQGNSPNPLSSADLMDWQAGFGKSITADASLTIPEPNSLAIVLLGPLLLTWRLRSVGLPLWGFVFFGRADNPGLREFSQSLEFAPPWAALGESFQDKRRHLQCHLVYSRNPDDMLTSKKPQWG